MNASKLAPVLLAALLLAACASPSPAPVLLTLPPTLSGLSGAAPAPPHGDAMPLLAVRRITIPEYVVARRVRYRADAATLAEWPNTYWAERVEIGVSREFVSALRQELPGWRMCDADCGDRPPTLILQLDLVPMDYLRSTQKLQARARITVSGGAPAAVLQTLESSHEIAAAADTPQAQAQAMSQLIQQVAAAAAPLVRAARP